MEVRIWLRPYLAAIILCSAHFVCTADRKLFIRDLINPAKCRNTVQGLRFVTDSKGVLCGREDVDSQTNCCLKGVRHTCDKCSLEDRCCSDFEDCVSCCLDPKHDAQSLARVTLRSPKHKDAGNWDDPFEYCRGVCRTHGKSTVHENAYIGARHHCFSKLGKPMLSAALPPGALSGVVVIMSDSQQSCDQACSARSRSSTCSAKHLPLLNSCDRLRELVPCEAGCEASTPKTGGAVAGGGAPGYMDTGAAKGNRPAMCFVAPDKSVASLSCGSKEVSMKRICPCTK